MNIYIFVDMEGISGISNSAYVTADGRLYQTGRRLYTQDINACARGCFQAGAQGVIVRDGHSDALHALVEELDPRVELVQGTGQLRRMPGLDECDALILLGYHAMAGTREALLEHTFSSAAIQNMWLNGRPVGEIGIDAGIAADLNIPAIMISGDDKACAEARAWMPEIVTCQVKTGLATQCARLLPLETAHRLIEEKTVEAIRAMGNIPPMRVERPVTLRKEMVERHAIPNPLGRPDIRIIDGRTYEVTADSVEEGLLRL